MVTIRTGAANNINADIVCVIDVRKSMFLLE